MSMRLLQVLFAFLLLGVPSSHAAGEKAILVFRDGRRMEARSYETKGAVTYVTDQSGSVVVVKTELIDFDRSRLATEAARRPPTPPPATPRKKSIVELSREMQERRRRAGPTPGIPERTPTPAPTTLTRTPLPLATSPARVAAPATPIPAAGTPTPAPSVAAATPTPAPQPVPEPGISPILLYALVGAVLGGIVGGVVFMLNRKRAPVGKRPAAKSAEAAASSRPAAEEELLTPAFAREDSAEDIPVPLPLGDEDLQTPGELTGAGADRKALTSGAHPAAPAAPGASRPAPELRPASPGILEEGHEVQIRIGADVYTCPDLATLRRWVEEGRVIETSEVLSPDGSWLMAGSIPDLESAFERRRETLGY